MIDINEIRLLRMRETHTQKTIKKALFIVISIIFPLIELIANILQILSFINLNNSYFDFSIGVLIALILGSLICTWGMVSVCYLGIVCIKILLMGKLFFIFLILFLLKTDFSNIFNYNLVFNVVGYGTFYTLIIVYKIYPKGII